MAGEGGVLINPEGIIENRYAWGLGMKTNNQVDALGLFLGLSVAQNKGIKDMQILGDSMLIIKHMNYNSATQNINLNQIIKRSLGIIPLFDRVNFFHILRSKNKDADKQANMVCQMNE